MTAQLPPNLLRLFAPRPPLPYIAPVDKDPKKRKRLQYTGLSAYLNAVGEDDLEYVPTETMLEKSARLLKEKKEKAERLKKLILKSWDPTKEENATGDPYKTLFISNLAFDMTEKQLRKEFEQFGELKDIKIIVDKKGKPKGYVFIEFERESAMKLAYKETNGMKLNGRRITVDVERGRTVSGWLPKKLGGGLGKKRVGGTAKPRKDDRMDDRRPAGRYEDRRGGSGGGGYSRGGYSRGGGSQRGGSRFDDRRGDRPSFDRRDDRGGSYDRRDERSSYDRGSYDRRDERSSRDSGRGSSRGGIGYERGERRDYDR